MADDAATWAINRSHDTRGGLPAGGSFNWASCPESLQVSKKEFVSDIRFNDPPHPFFCAIVISESKAFNSLLWTLDTYSNKKKKLSLFFF